MIRPATPHDVPAILTMVRDLAEYERARDEATVTEAQLRTALFGENPAVFAHIAEDEDTGEAVGFALWFLNFSTWHGSHGIYLEDLFVLPEHRGSGLGKALLTELAEECVRRGYTRLQWWVLNWNTPAIDFYRSVGAVPMDEWTVYRLTGDALDELGGAVRAGGRRPSTPA
jgi:GNAT superfamily N-acetyltransferase